MGKKDDFEGDPEASFLGSIIVTLMALVIVAVAAAGAYFLLFKNNEDVQKEEAVASMEESSPQDSAGPEVTKEPKPTMTPIPAPRESGEENPVGMGQDLEETKPTMMPDKTATPEPVNVEAGHHFTEVSETVTAKEATNLRSMPSQGELSKVLLTLYNGQEATRIGVSDSGWSKVIYNGETYYAVSSYLTTDLIPPTPMPEEDGIKTVFTECDEMVAPKIEVNLRTLPSVTNPESLVVVKLPYGTSVRRTGINRDVGWSRVEYEGQVLYCVSSYVFVVE